MNDDTLGYLKYSGELVKEGMLDAKKAAQALTGLDKALRFFIARQNQKFGELPFEIPVKIREGSWEALIPQTVGQWVLTGLGISTTTYVATAAKKLAENDFKEASLKVLFYKSFKAIQWCIEIGKHLGSMSQKKIEKPKFKDNNQTIGIPNAQGEYLDVPKEYWECFMGCPESLLSDIVKLIEVDREMKIGVNENDSIREVSVSVREKYIFAYEGDQVTLFPELLHGQNVELEGELTRGNEITNTVGFKYKDHILTCRPLDGSIVEHKNALFLKCKIVGTIDRIDETSLPAAKKPKIVFSRIISIDKKKDFSFFTPADDTVE